MEKYYVDVRSNEITTDIYNLAPELYYSYEKGTMEGVIIEKYYCGKNECINFSHSYPSDEHVNLERHLHFKKHNASPSYMYAYVVPPSIYEEVIKKYESSLVDNKEE